MTEYFTGTFGSSLPVLESAPDQGHYLSVLAQVGAEEVKLFTEELLPQLGEVEVIQNRTGLAMLPATDSAKGGVFHLGEVLVAEAHVRVGQQEGYAACLGRDLVQALALAILDAVLQDVDANPAIKPQILQFVERMDERQQMADLELLRKVETTRVELEVF
jgi:alpha-D-ribose 1-methylphosphonate 5-triphosphate synthase subunit PhnG